MELTRQWGASTIFSDSLNVMYIERCTGSKTCLFIPQFVCVGNTYFL